ncbi:MAG TPA: FecR family protein [Chitinophagaceae bacterium]
MTEKINWKYLIEKFTKNTCTKEEFDQLLKWVEQDHDNEDLTKELQKYWENAGNESKSSSIDWEKKFSTLLDEARQEAPVIPLYKDNHRKIQLKKWAAAASVLLLISMGGYFGFYNKNEGPVDISKTINKHIQPNKDVAPGGSKAILTLADGSIINLDSAQNGTLATQGNIKVIKGEDGQLLYYVDQENSNAVGYNTISTPRGGKYEIVLSDGTKVWLNAASSLKFPASFTGKIREVVLTGEGYFEVAKNAMMPFQVKVDHMTVEVLGTHFNVNAYSEEPDIETTLLEGSIKIKKAGKVQILSPGEQAKFTSSGIFINKNADLQQVMAWKEGFFLFDNTDIYTLMRQVARWYDVEVNFEGKIAGEGFTGKISRNVPLSKFLKVLELNEVHIKTEGKKITIKP